MDNRLDNMAPTARKGERLAGALARRRRVRRLLVVLGIMAVLATAISLMLPAISMTRGDLVCSLEEHSHSASCYEKVLVCGQEEGEGADPETGEGGHVHAKDCYEKKLVCEVPEHEHSDACYEQAQPDDKADDEGKGDSGDDASSGKDASDSGKSADDGGAAATDGGDADKGEASADAADPSASASSASASSVGAVEAGSGSDMPAQSFKADLKDAKGKVTLTVEVEAPKGAFPAGTFMKIDGVDAGKVQKKVQKAIERVNGKDVKVKNLTAVDIVFHEGGPDGKEIEPAKKVQVKITSKDVRDFDDPVLVHVVDKSKDSAKGKTDDAEVVEKVKIVNRDEDPDDSGDTMKFKSDEFSPYVIVELEELTTQVITASGETYDVKVTYGPDAGIPEDARLEVREIAEGDEGYDGYVSQVSNKLGGEPAFARLFDITIMVDGEPVQPDVPVDVEVSLVDAAELSNSVQAVHFADDGVVEVLDASLKGETVSFTANSFSVYAVVDEGAGEKARMTVEFYNGSTKIATLYVKNDDTAEELEYILYDPGVGTLQSGELFTGWILDNENYTSADVANAMTIDDVRNWAERLTIQEGDVHKLYASICKLYHVVYKDDDDAHTPVGMVSVPVKSSEYGMVSVPYTVNMAYTPKDDVHKFEGWIAEEDSVSNITSNVPSDRLYQNGTLISIKGDVAFVVNEPPGNWLVFDENGKGATYNAPQFVKADEVTTRPRQDSDMTRKGYRFGGWYDTKEHADAHAANPSDTTGEFTFGNELTQKTTVYASWIPNARAQYTVVLWTQNQNRTAYEVAGSYVGEGQVGQSIPYVFVNNGDEDYVTGVGANNGHYTGFCLKAEDANQQITITPEGDAVLNLHYDRIQYNMRIYLYRKGAGNNSYQYAQNSNRGQNVWGIATWYGESGLNNMPTTTYGNIYYETVGGYTGYYILLSAYYGEDISSKWPRYAQISSPANNRSPVSFVMMNGTGLKGNSITDNGYGDGRDTIKGLITTMDEKILGKTNDSNGNYLIVRFNTYNSWRYHIWFETVDGEDYTGKTTHTYNGKTYYEANVIESRSSNTDVGQQNPPQYTGFEYYTRRNQNWNNENSWTTNNPTLYHINYVYDRLSYKISYFDGNYVDGDGNTIQNRATHLLHESQDINQGAVVPDENRNYEPNLPEGEEGYVFAGWYLDEACTTSYTWGTMPVGGIKVYAKWQQEEFRVFLHPNAGTDQSLDWGSDTVSTCFRVAYGETVSPPTGKRPNSGYEFVGWYTDPSCSSQYLYNPDTELNNDTVTTPYDQTEDTELDKWGNVIPGQEGNKDAANGRYWITKKLDLYAKWRKVLEGSEGISVVYTADDGNGHVGSNAPIDPSLYPDQSEATGQAASTAPDGMEFKYWVMQRWDETQNKYVDTKTTVVPGQVYTVNEALAHKVEDAEHPGEYKYTVQLRAEYAAPESGLPTHIWWFKNYSDNGNERHGSFHQDERIQINEAVSIQSAPTRDGYRFLGWAREPVTVTKSEVGTPPTGKVLESLGVSDVYLKYENGQYKLNDSTSSDYGKVVTEVAADERKDYHDMYAVWERVYTVAVKKVVDSGIDADKQIDFIFTESQTIDGVSGADSFILKDGGEKKYENMFPSGSTFSVTETDNENFDISVSGKYIDADGAEHVISDLVNGSMIAIQGDTVITVTNKRKSAQITIKKVDEDNQPLAGATFQLLVKNASGTYVNNGDPFVIDSEGAVYQIDLPTGDYKLVETVSPAGYVIESTGEEFSVNAAVSTGVITLGAHTDASLDTTDTTGRTLVITNHPGVALPSTGGMGTEPLMLLGVVLVAGAAAFLVARRRPLVAISREWAYITARDTMGKRACERKGFTRIVVSRKNRR